MSTVATPLPASGIAARIGPWIALQELPKHLAGILPFILGSVLAYWVAGTIDWAVFWVALLALYLLTNGTYISNEYFDLDNDIANTTRIGGDDRVSVTTTGGTRVLVKGLISPKAALNASIAFFLLAIPVGLYLQFGLGTGWATLPLGLLALFIGWFYTAPPIRACYRGLGEAFIAVGQGTIVFGAFYIQQGFNWLPILVSLPWLFALPALKIMREFPDLDADLSTGKRGLTLILGRRRASTVYVTLIALSLLSFLPVYAILGLPLALVTLAPIALLGRSALIMVRGGWLDPEGAERAAVSGFIGMLLIPVTLAAAFLAQALT
jgi:1,4-dihydroxy-2-naphthoate polyprenyltransferase